jgi:organic hydroperoxide reductase OsmC/OhrA
MVTALAWWQAGIRQSRRSSMIRTHSYDVTVAWTGNRGSGTSGYREYGRDHEITVSGAGDAGRPPPIAGSSDSAFRGDLSRWNPEQLLTAALAQCHMLSYLHACAAAGIVVTGYTDEAHGTMTETTDGGGHFIEVVLRPRVTVTTPDMVDKATGLHREAHEKCFIASSVNFPVRHEPVVLAASTAGQPGTQGGARCS